MYGQLIFCFFYGLLYLASPRTAHRFVGYLEEEAVKTYTNFLKEIDEGHLPLFETQEPAKDTLKYYGLPDDAKFRDIIVAIRADEILHREFNHHLADIPGDTKIDGHRYVFRDEDETRSFDVKH